MTKTFFDTNVLLYLLSSDAAKANRAEAILAAGGKISVQVLNEFAAVASRKFRMEWREIRDVLAPIQAVCEVVPLTVDIHHLGSELAERYQLGIYDALIVAAAIDANCNTLYSEDLQHGQVFKKTLRVRNPFHS